MFYGKAAESLRSGKEALERGDYQTAIKKFMEVQEHNGTPSAVAEGKIGLSYMGLGKNEQAIRHLSNAIEIEDNALRRNNRGDVYMMTGQCDKASEDARAALAMEPVKGDRFHTDMEANLILAICHSRQGQHMLALQHAESAIEIATREGYTNEKTANIRAMIGDSYKALGQNENAVANYSTSIDLSDNSTARTKRGSSYLASHRCNLAIDDAKAALAMEPKKAHGIHTDVEANFILASCYAQNGNYLSALQHAEATLEMASIHAYPAVYLDMVATTELSIREVLKGTIPPEDLVFEPALTHIKTGADFLEQGDYKAALASFLTAQEKHGTRSGDIQVWIGHAYSAMGDHENAIKHYTKAVETRDNALRRINRGNEYANQGQCPEANRDAEAALGMEAYTTPGFHTDTEAHWILGICLLEQGNHRNALFHMDQAVTIARASGYTSEDISTMSEVQEITRQLAGPDP